MGRNISVQCVRKPQEVSMVDQYDSFEPVLLADHQGDPRIIDTIFNVSSLTSGIFNNSLFQYAGLVIVGIILLGKTSSQVSLFLFSYFKQEIRNFPSSQHLFNSSRPPQFLFKSLNNIYLRDQPEYFPDHNTPVRLSEPLSLYLLYFQRLLCMP